VTQAEVTSNTTDSAPQKLWKEWLSGYFDGASHDIGPSGTGAVTFPAASIRFDQSSLDQPLAEGLNIHVIAQTLRSFEFLSDTGKVITHEMRWQFLVRASSVDAGKGTPELVCRDGTQLLKACLMNDYAVQPLAQKGIFDLKVTEAEPLQSTSYILRRVNVRGRLQFENRSTPP
jgi:hypothetical protein